MERMSTRTTRAFVALTAFAFLASACGGGEELDQGTDAAQPTAAEVGL